MTSAIESAARALALQLAKRRGADWARRLRLFYAAPWVSGETEHRLARMLVDLRSAGVDVRTAYDMAERELRETEADVPVRDGAEGLA
jgi:hypothetical protein